MSKTLVSADCHFGHSNIIKYCKRPFASVDEMNSTIIQRWNQTVQQDDTVWFLGDFCFKGYERLFDQLNGRKHLIIGNHDPRATLVLPWASQPQYYHEMKIDGTRVVLFHYGMRTWNGMYKGAIQLYGHSHSTLPGFRTPSGGGTLDVGVDSWDFYPVTLEQIKARIITLPEVQTEIHEPRT